AFENINNDLPQHRLSESINLLTNIYIKKNQTDKAISLLTSSTNDSTWDAYSKFNLGSSLIYKNRLGDARTFLDQVSNLEPHNQEQNALRDKANLALGYVSLKINQPLDAIQHFNKVRLNNALSSKALLGAGWAWSSKSMHEKSLIPWMELKNYNQLDASVQESLIAIPYTLEQIGKPELALTHYSNAINSYTQQSDNLDRVIESINNGAFIKSLSSVTMQHESYLRNLQTNKHQNLYSPYLYELFSSNEFQHQLNKLQDLIYLQQLMSRWSNNLPALNLMLDERKKNYQRKLRELEERKLSVIIQPLINKRNKLSNILKNIDALALASKEGQEKLKSLSIIKNKIARISNKYDVSDLQEKYDRLYGVIYWDINTDYKPRLWQATKSLKELNKEIDANTRLQESLATSIANAPKSFTGYSKRIAGQHRKIQKLNEQIHKALNEQKNRINTLALISSKNQKDRLNSYQLRARYSLARLYDKQSRSSGASNE
ncbi:MAG: hypothetical protein OQK76_11350, partial [Gammaproteobacteria bacterium]|nr:hypothetical protein [Gammaproteobacteria bacterium]